MDLTGGSLDLREIPRSWIENPLVGKASDAPSIETLVLGIALIMAGFEDDV